MRPVCRWGTSLMARLCEPMPVSGRTSVPVDACISHLVSMLNEAGVKTTGSCCGHGKAEGSITYEHDGVSYEIFLPMRPIAGDEAARSLLSPSSPTPSTSEDKSCL